MSIMKKKEKILIRILNEQIEQLEYKDKQNKDIEEIINEEEQPVEVFDDVKFEI